MTVMWGMPIGDVVLIYLIVTQLHFMIFQVLLTFWGDASCDLFYFTRGL